LVLVGMSGFCGSDPFVVMTADRFALLVGVLPPPDAHPVSTSALAAARATTPTPIRFFLKVSSCANWQIETLDFWPVISNECVAPRCV
jgi:hypothetical protein